MTQWLARLRGSVLGNMALLENKAALAFLLHVTEPTPSRIVATFLAVS
jgi:hypothetical protein